MTFIGIRTLYKGGVYNPVRVKIPTSVPADTIFDENQSVRWNREKAAAINNARKEAMAKNRAAENEVSRCFENDIIEALQDEYEFSPPRQPLFIIGLMSPDTVLAMVRLCRMQKT